jgi:hypothetical protein
VGVSPRRSIRVLVLVGVGVVVANVVMRLLGYAIPGRTVVRCSQGHLFTTMWIEGGSLQALRLGPTLRYQWCPTCRHGRLVRPVKDADLSDDDRREAAAA